MCTFGLSGCRVKPRRPRNGQLWPNMNWSFVAPARAVAMASSGGIDVLGGLGGPCVLGCIGSFEDWVADLLRPLDSESFDAADSVLRVLSHFADGGRGPRRIVRHCLLEIVLQNKLSVAPHQTSSWQPYSHANESGPAKGKPSLLRNGEPKWLEPKWLEPTPVRA